MIRDPSFQVLTEPPHSVELDQVGVVNGDSLAQLHQGNVAHGGQQAGADLHLLVHSEHGGVQGVCGGDNATVRH